MLLAGQAATARDVLAWVAVDPSQSGSVAALCGAVAELKPEKPVSATNGTNTTNTTIRASLSVTVDDGLARSFIVTPPSGAQGLAELRASAAARFTALYGESGEAWLLAADWQATAPFIACALPRPLYQALDGLAQMSGWRLESVRPALAHVWNRLRASIPDDGWLIVGFGQTLTLVHTAKAQVAGLRTVRLPGAPDLPELVTLLEQEHLRAQVPGEAHDRQALLWTGAADWLPVAPTIAGLTSRALPLRAHLRSAGDLSEPCQLACHLALAGSVTLSLIHI